jgi:hypothetical protein
VRELSQFESQEDSREYDVCRLLDFARVAVRALREQVPMETTVMVLNRTTGRPERISSQELAGGLEYFLQRVVDHKA